MASKRRNASILLAICAVLNAVFVVAQQTGSKHAPVAVTALTAVAVLLLAAGAIRLRGGDGWSWPVAVVGAALSAVLAVGAVANAPGVGKVAAVLLLALSLGSVFVMLPLRKAGRGAGT